MIIGVSGKINSGKDTIGTIIQYLTSKEIGTFEASTISQKVYGSLYPNYTNWEIKKFAGKLKDCVCIILGCTREQLEDINFKNTELGEEWIRYGRADGFFQGGSQGTVMNNASCTKEEYEAELRINWQTAYKFNHTPRSILQMLGTEVGRFIHSNFWVNALFTNYKIDHFMYGNTPFVLQPNGRYRPNNLNHSGMSKQDMINLNATFVEGNNWIITDVRFPNELAAIKERGGIVIRVNREDERSRFAAIDKPEERSKYYHPSETSLDNATFDYTIDNNGTIDELIIKVRLILESLNIIK